MSEAFNTYLIEKNIHPELFRDSEPELYERFNLEFEQSHPKSFTEQKKFFINDLRRRFLYKNFNTPDQDKAAPASNNPSPKPVFKKPTS